MFKVKNKVSIEKLMKGYDIFMELKRNPWPTDIERAELATYREILLIGFTEWYRENDWLCASQSVEQVESFINRQLDRVETRS